MTKDSSNPKKALIFNIQRFSVQDGPGIRTTVFMKGCPLRCLWCSNPESQDFQPNLIVRKINCKGCGACTDVCPNGAITIEPGEISSIDWSLCNQCLKCVEACKYQALNICGKYMTMEEVLDEVKRDRAFYKNSGGGITVSGGEALCQSEFVANLLKSCQHEGINTAIDTTGCVAWENIEEVLPYTDLFLYDIKHLDSVEHRKSTGVPNDVILQNLHKLSRLTRIWLRTPLIAGFNDDEEHIKRLAVLARDLHAEKVSLLPYHEGGQTKCEQLGRVYPYPNVSAPSDQWIQKLKDIIEYEGVKVSIGS